MYVLKILLIMPILVIKKKNFINRRASTEFIFPKPTKIIIHP